MAYKDFESDITAGIRMLRITSRETSVNNGSSCGPAGFISLGGKVSTQLTIDDCSSKPSHYSHKY
jgi:hypothetical protein